MEIIKFFILTCSIVFAGIAVYKCVRVLLLHASYKRIQKGEKRNLFQINGEDEIEEIHKEIVGRLERVPLIKQRIDAYKEKKYMKQLRAKMPEALRLLCMALDSGSSLVRAIDYAAENVSEPLSYELKRTVWDLEAGQAFDEAMQHLRKRTGGSEFAYLAVAMEIQHSSGGSMSGIINSVSNALQQSAEMEEELRTKTTQARLSSRIVIVMPIVILIVFSIFSPGYLANFFTSALGVLMLVAALALEIVGIILVRKYLNVDLNAHVGGEIV